MMERIAVLFTFHMHRETGWTAFSTSPTKLAISRCAGLTGCRLLSRSESSRRPADQAAGLSSPAFIRTHTDECGKCPDKVDNQGNKAVLPGTALAWTLTTTSQSTLISSRNAHGQISDAGAWRTFEIYWTSKTTTHAACSRQRRRDGCLQCDQKRCEVRRAFCGTAAPSREPTGQPGQSGSDSPGRIPTISPLDHQCVR